MAKLKPPLYYTLHWGWRRSGYEIIAVTTEKSYQLFGRYVKDDSATHVRRSECRGRFDTLEAAKAVIDKLEAIRAKHAPIIEAAERACAAARLAEERELKAALKDAE